MAESGEASNLRRWLRRLTGGAAAGEPARRLALAGAGGGAWDWTGGRALRPDNDDIVFDVTAFAAQLGAGDGWVVDQAALPPEEVERRLAADSNVSTFRILGRGRGQGRDARGFARPHRPASYTAFSQGWAYDQAAGRWRAPGEALAAFPWPAESADALVMALGRPAWGWMPMAFAAGEKTVAFEADCGACPFEPMVDWLEAVAAGAETAGGAGRFGSLHGATRVEWHAFAGSAPQRVRFAIALYDGGATDDRTVALDIDIERRELVLALYGGQRAYAEGPEFRPFAWAYVRLADELLARFPAATAADLAGLDAGRLGRLADKINRRHPGPAGGAALAAWIDAPTVAPPDDEAGAVAGDLPDIPAAWDGWDAAMRLAWLPHLLEAAVSGWIGSDLRHLHSAALEDFLARG